MVLVTNGPRWMTKLIFWTQCLMKKTFKLSVIIGGLHGLGLACSGPETDLFLSTIILQGPTELSDVGSAPLLGHVSLGQEFF